MQKTKMKLMTVAIGAVVAASFATAQVQSDVTRLNVNLKDADLVTATKMVTERTGLQFMFRSTKAFNKVTLQLKDMAADDVIRYICDSAGAYVTKDENGVYVISANKPVIESPTISKKTGGIMKKIKLLHAGADEIYSQVVMSKILDPSARQSQNLRALNMARLMVSGTDLGSKSFGVLDSVSSFNRYQPQSTPSKTAVSDNGNSIQTPGEEASQRGGLGGGGGGGLGGGGGQGGFGGGGGLGGGGGQGGAGGGQGQGGGTQLVGGQGLVPDSIDHITYDPTDNSLIVRGTSEEDINTLQNIIAQFDVRPRQVQIKVEFITTTENLDQSLGYNVNYSRGTVIAGIAGQDFLRASDPVFLTYASGDAVFRLRTRLAEGIGRVVTAPVIRTMNNTPATVFAFTNDWILTSTTIQTNGGGLVTTINPQQLTLGTGLSVTPRINGDGTITMGLTPSVQSTVGTRQVTSSGTSFELPITASQSVSVVINVKDKETIVLGGMTTESTNTTTTRVPVLSDLPIIGQFFKKVVKGRTASELLIFVTPVIIEDEDTGIAP